MSSSGYHSSGRNYQENRQLPTIDFSKPPPGYSPHGKQLSDNKAYSKTSPTSRNSAVNTANPPPASPNRPQINPVNHAYYRGNVSESPQSLPQTRPPENPPPPPPPDTIDPRMYPPPPPPAEPYPSMAINPAAVAAPTYIMSSTVYAAFGMPPPSALSPASLNQAALNQATMNHAINPAAMNGIIPVGMGAGHQFMNMNQQQNFRLPPQQYQGEYGAGGYSRRRGYNNYVNRKRSANSTALSESDPETPAKRSNSKKKKKPLSQNMPAKKDWTMEEARRALETEKDFNKRHRSPSLIIKFPDLELNRDIVSKFHPKIDNVHFQQPSTPRFCFVTLKDGECVDQVIKDLCKIKFGDGYLVAETKNNKDDEMVKGPEDIDPLTLYVGNLAQEVTVDDVVKAYPKHKRIDIGFAKKMKYTRYAFVSFRTVDDAIEGFQATHSTEMYNKSLIVRFRRLHGTVGLPGDAKVQNPPRAEGQAVDGKNLSPILNNIKHEIVSRNYGPDDEDESNEEEEDVPHDLKSILFDSHEERVKVMNRNSSEASFSVASRDRFDSGSSFNSIHVKNEPPDYEFEPEFTGLNCSRDEYPPKVVIKTELDMKPNIKTEQGYDDKYISPIMGPAGTSANFQSRESAPAISGQSKNGLEKSRPDHVEVKKEPLVSQQYSHRSEDEDEDEDPTQEYDNLFSTSQYNLF
ncbi:uncharacterized protein LOC126746097 isoform X3 [Anthonomus grandis grandis]|uniref:uncharacterized protein LOC126746097 isoform X1 n=1 Tax=Anthonomus grandis grandis TaxID=2921223 RepID=UPI0021668D67|nr:uncharacterized protein LOC126746097 isoform X1 [Anthonomus grandis grandis]XP_050310164.1 uncharacterized protein LOC126746097 isoform X2 [Anthonomus grandis grandis]XP_050310165.1 uncharacterized protein LOC126746097 isoform X3 [Anthonomus grandis grandis]